MLTREITYKDGNTGEMVTEKFYFNLNKRELLKFNFDYESKGGIEGVIKKAAQSGEQKELFDMIDELLLTSYGIKAADGKGFTKTEELKKQFLDSFAYEALFEELIENEDNALKFINGVVPDGFKNVFNEADKQKIVSLPDISTKE